MSIFPVIAIVQLLFVATNPTLFGAGVLLLAVVAALGPRLGASAEPVLIPVRVFVTALTVLHLLVLGALVVRLAVV